jgi:hypothetical protein
MFVFASRYLARFDGKRYSRPGYAAGFGLPIRSGVIALIGGKIEWERSRRGAEIARA